jgi:hypothetical protein
MSSDSVHLLIPGGPFHDDLVSSSLSYMGETMWCPQPPDALCIANLENPGF